VSLPSRRASAARTSAGNTASTTPCRNASFPPRRRSSSWSPLVLVGRLERDAISSRPLRRAGSHPRRVAGRWRRRAGRPRRREVERRSRRWRRTPSCAGTPWRSRALSCVVRRSRRRRRRWWLPEAEEQEPLGLQRHAGRGRCLASLVPATHGAEPRRLSGPRRRTGRGRRASTPQIRRPRRTPAHAPPGSAGPARASAPLMCRRLGIDPRVVLPLLP
jgi:hypothetical protein